MDHVKRLIRYTVEFLTRQRRPTMLVERIFARGGVCILAAPTYTGKTFFALEAMRAVATGTPFLGHFKVPKPGNVLYLGNDSPAWDLASQFDKLIGLPDPALVNIGQLIEQTDLGAYGFIFDHTFALNTEVDARAVIRAANESRSLREYEEDIHGAYQARHIRGTDLIVIDTLRSVHGFEENDNTGMQHVMNLLRLVAIETGASVLALHHFNKGNAESPKAAIERLRGATAIGAAVDSVFVLTGSQPSLSIRVLKHRPCPEQRDFMYDQMDTAKGVTLTLSHSNGIINLERATFLLSRLVPTGWTKTSALAYALIAHEEQLVLTLPAAEKAVNRALAALEKDGKVVRVHGAARLAPPETQGTEGT